MSKTKALLFRFVLIGALGIASVFIANIALGQDGGDEKPHWTYEGEEGAEHWGELSPDFIACMDGTAQSPINVVDAIPLDLSDIQFSYDTSAINILNNGHTIQVNADEGSYITYNEIRYDLLQFHFHHPSEHWLNGEPAAMEIHFVHRDPASGNLAVVGVLLVEGEENVGYADIMANLPAEESEAEDIGMDVAFSDLLPEQLTYYTYQGSLTTPPCSQIVRWLLLDTPVELSAEQIENFASIFEMNARPVQELNDRDLFVDVNE